MPPLKLQRRTKSMHDDPWSEWFDVEPDYAPKSITAGVTMALGAELLKEVTLTYRDGTMSQYRMV